MHILKDPSFFLTKRTVAPHGEKLGLMNPLFRSSLSWLDNYCISVGANLLVDLAIGVALGTRSIQNSVFRSRGIPGRSSVNTSGKSHADGML